MELRRSLDLFLLLWRTGWLRNAALRRGVRCCGRLVQESDQTEPTNPNLSCPASLFSAQSSLPFQVFFLWCDLLLTRSHQYPSFSTIPLPPSKSHAPIHVLILLMSGQCTSTSLPYPWLVCVRPFNKSKFSFKCYGCLSWIHQRCSGLASYTHHHDLWFCSKFQTKCPQPPFYLAHLNSSLMDNPLFLPRYHPLTGKGDVPPSLLSPPPLMRRPHLTTLPWSEGDRLWYTLAWVQIPSAWSCFRGNSSSSKQPYYEQA